MRQIVPGLFLGDVEASYKQNMLEEIVSIQLFPYNARWVLGTSLLESQVSQGTVTSRSCAKTRNTRPPCSHERNLRVVGQMASDTLISLSSLPVDHTADELCHVFSKARLIHCDLGISRSPTIILAYLIDKLPKNHVGALVFVQSKEKTAQARTLLVGFDVEGMSDMKYGRIKI